MNIKNILFATDFSDNSVLAFNSAKSLAEEHNAKLLILYVHKDTEDTRFHDSIAHLAPEKMHTEDTRLNYSIARHASEGMQGALQQNIEEHFSHFLEKNAGDFMNYEKIVRHGKPFKEILKFAEERTIDLIVAGSHGRTGIEHVMFGSTSERLVRKTKTPVLIIPGEH